MQLIPRPQQMANNLQRQGRSAQLVERRSYCTDKLFVLVCCERWGPGAAVQSRVARSTDPRACRHVSISPLELSCAADFIPCLATQFHKNVGAAITSDSWGPMAGWLEVC